MKKIMSKKNKTIILSFFSLLLCFPLSFSYGKQSKKNEARQCFEYAYFIEDKAPKQAMEMYAWALEKGLGKKGKPSLGRAAYWRLYYLYLEDQSYLKAFLLLGEIEKWNQRKYKKKELQRLEERLSFLIKRDWGLSEEDLSILYSALGDLKGAKGLREKEDELKGYFIRVIEGKKNKEGLLKILMGFLVKKDQIAIAKKILDDLLLSKISPLKAEQYFLYYARLQVEEGKHRKARESLEQIEVMERDLYLEDKSRENLEKGQEEISQEERELKIEFYYLQGRIERNRKSYLRSADYFQKAASFGEKQSLHSQAAYSLFLGGKFQRARSLLELSQIRPYTDEEILSLMLKIKLSKKKDRKEAKRKLRKMRAYLKAKSLNEKSLLAQRALALSR